MDQFSHEICIIRRSNHNKMHSYTVDPATDFVHRQLRIQLRKLKENEVLDLFRQFSRVPNGGMTGLLFEAHFQKIFAKSVDIDAKPMFRSPAKNSRWHSTFGDFSAHPSLRKAHGKVTHSSLPLCITPVGTTEYAIKGPDEQYVIKEDWYYIPLADNEEAIDSLILHDGYLYLFQFTTSSSHDIKPGLQDFLSRFAGLQPHYHWRFIFIIPDNLRSFSCPHSDKGFLLDQIPYTAQVTAHQYQV
jgi:hypothetical protein